MWSTNFRAGNIVLSAAVISSIDDLSECMPAATTGLAQSANQAVINAYVDRMRLREARIPAPQFFVLESSFGCDMVICYDGGLEVVSTVGADSLAP